MPSAADEARKVLDTARRLYLSRLRRACSLLPLAAMGGDEGTDDEVALDQVYVELNTTTRVPLTDED